MLTLCALRSEVADICKQQIGLQVQQDLG